MQLAVLVSIAIQQKHLTTMVDNQREYKKQELNCKSWLLLSLILLDYTSSQDCVCSHYIFVLHIVSHSLLLKPVQWTNSSIPLFSTSGLGGQRSPLINFDWADVQSWPIETLMQCVRKLYRCSHTLFIVCNHSISICIYYSHQEHDMTWHPFFYQGCT